MLRVISIVLLYSDFEFNLVGICPFHDFNQFLAITINNQQSHVCRGENVIIHPNCDQHLILFQMSGNLECLLYAINSIHEYGLPKVATVDLIVKK